MDINQTVSKISNLIAKAVNAKILNPKLVRVIGLSLDGDKNYISLFASNYWNEYIDFADRFELATLGLSEQLDEFDKNHIAKSSEQYHKNEYHFVECLYDHYVAVIRELVKDYYTEYFTKRPAFVMEGFQYHTQIVAWAHHDGYQPLLNLSMSKDKVYESDHSMGSLNNKGITLFFPAGLGAGLGTKDETEEQTTVVKHFPLKNIISACPDGNRNIKFKVRGGGAADIIGAGITSDHDPLTQKQIYQALQQYFATYVKTWFDKNHPPNPVVDKEFKRWNELYNASGDRHPDDVLTKIYDKYGIEAADLFVKNQERSNQGYSQLIGGYVFILMQEKKWQRALETSRLIKGEGDVWLFGNVVRIHLMLGDNETALSTAKELVTDRFVGLKAKGLAVIAYDRLGQTEQASQLAESMVNESPEKAHSHYALAYILRHTDPEQAIQSYRQAMRSDGFDDDYAADDFSDAADDLLAVIYSKAETENTSDAEALPPFEYQGADSISINTNLKSFQSGWNWQKTRTIPGYDEVNYNLLTPCDGNWYFRFDHSGPVSLITISDKDYTVTSQIIGGSSEVRINDACYQNGMIYTVDSDGYIYTHSINDVSVTLSRVEPNQKMSAEHIRVQDDILCVSFRDGVEIYKINDTGVPQYQSFLKTDRGRSNAQCRDMRLYRHADKTYLFMALNYTGVMSADISDPSKPQVIECVAHNNKDDNKEPRALDRLFVWKNYLLADDEYETTYIYDIRQPDTMRLVCKLPIVHEATHLFESHGNLLLFKSGFFWELDLTAKGDSVIGDIIKLQDDSSCEYGNVMLGDRFLTVRSHEYDEEEDIDDDAGERYDALVFEKTEKEIIDTDTMISSLKQGYLNWLDDQFTKAVNEKPDIESIGSIAISLTGYWFTVYIEEARSALGLNKRLEGDFCYKGQISRQERIGENNSAMESFLEQAPDELFMQLSREVATELQTRDSLKQFAARYVHVGESVYSYNFVRTLEFPDKPYHPVRVEDSDELTLSMSALLNSSDVGCLDDAIHDLASSEPAQFQELLAEAEAGNQWAIYYATKYADIDFDRASKSIVTAGLAGHIINQSIVFIRDKCNYKNDPAMLAVLEKAFNSDKIMHKLPAARALNKLETDEVIEFIKEKILSSSMDDKEQVANIFSFIESRIGDLKDTLIKASDDNHWRNDVYAKIAAALQRTDLSRPPLSLIKHADRNRGNESRGDEGFMDKYYEPDELCTQLREWYVDLLIERLQQARATKDHVSAVWFDDVKPEPKPKNWYFFFKQAWPKLSAAGLIEFMLECLIEHTVQDEKYAADQSMMSIVLEYCVEEGDYISQAIRLAKAIQDNNLKFSQSENSYVENILSYGVLKQAESKLKEGKLEAARKIINQLLATDPYDTQTLVLDIMLIAKEQDENGAIARIEEILPTLSTHHQVGAQPLRAQVFNLYGYYLDTLGKHKASLPWFLKAHEENPNAVIYMNNLAEIYDKLNAIEEALEWAQKARVAGSESAVVAGIMQKYSSTV